MNARQRRGRLRGLARAVRVYWTRGETWHALWNNRLGSVFTFMVHAPDKAAARCAAAREIRHWERQDVAHQRIRYDWARADAAIKRRNSGTLRWRLDYPTSNDPAKST